MFGFDTRDGFMRDVCHEGKSPPCRTPGQSQGVVARVDVTANTACAHATRGDPALLGNGVSQNSFPMQLH